MRHYAIATFNQIQEHIEPVGLQLQRLSNIAQLRTNSFKPSLAEAINCPYSAHLVSSLCRELDFPVEILNWPIATDMEILN